MDTCVAQTFEKIIAKYFISQGCSSLSTTTVLTNLVSISGILSFSSHFFGRIAACKMNTLIFIVIWSSLFIRTFGYYKSTPAASGNVPNPDKCISTVHKYKESVLFLREDKRGSDRSLGNRRTPIDTRTTKARDSTEDSLWSRAGGLASDLGKAASKIVRGLVSDPENLSTEHLNDVNTEVFRKIRNFFR
jgi:hypothetical protein